MTRQEAKEITRRGIRVFRVVTDGIKWTVTYGTEKKMNYALIGQGQPIWFDAMSSAQGWVDMFNTGTPLSLGANLD